MSTDKPHIFYVAMKYDYGKPENGLGFEHMNFFDALHRSGFDITYFDPMQAVNELGKQAAAEKLWDMVQAEKPVMMFTVLFTDQLDFETVRRISDETDTVTFNWFCDDHWRFDNYSKDWAWAFNHVATTANSAVPKYQAMGYDRALKTQWAANPFQYQKIPGDPIHDVSFVGRPHGNRTTVIDALKKAGIDVVTHGEGWPSGPINHQQMVETFSRSRINLNLSNASLQSEANPSLKQRCADLLQRGAHRLPRPAACMAQGLARQLQDQHDPITAGGNLYSQQIKGRNFEVPGCGGFLLTSPADDLESYYKNGEEIVVFDSLPSLIEQIRHALANEDWRQQVAQAGHARTMAEHTYPHRFKQLFKTMLPNHDWDAHFTQEHAPGQVVEVFS